MFPQLFLLLRHYILVLLHLFEELFRGLEFRTKVESKSIVRLTEVVCLQIGVPAFESACSIPHHQTLGQVEPFHFGVLGFQVVLPQASARLTLVVGFVEYEYF